MPEPWDVPPPLTTCDGLPAVSSATCDSTRDLLLRALANPGGLDDIVSDLNREQPILYRSLAQLMSAYGPSSQAVGVAAGFLTAYESLRRQAAANRLAE